MTAQYALEENTKYISVNNSGRKVSPSGPEVSAIGQAYVEAPGKLEVTFNIDLGIYAPYWIVFLWGNASQDYELALIYSCNQVGPVTVQWVWVLSRTTELPAPYTFSALYDILDAAGIDMNSIEMIQTQQQGCY